MRTSFTALKRGCGRPPGGGRPRPPRPSPIALHGCTVTGAWQLCVIMIDCAESAGHDRTGQRTDKASRMVELG